jgi:hypothetical protein
MKSKIFAVVLVILSMNALAVTIDKPFVLNCEGQDGSVHFEQTEKGLYYDLYAQHHHYAGFVFRYYKAPNGKWEQGTVSAFTSTDSKKYLSINAIHGNTVWNPALERCALSRSDMCRIITIPGHYSNQSYEWIDMMLDVSQKGQVKFYKLNMDKVTVSTLGQFTKCTLEGLDF